MPGVGIGVGIGMGLGLGTGGGYDPGVALGADYLGHFDARRADSLTLNGSEVSEWRCLKTGYAVVQATGAARPIFSVSSFNGDPGLYFDGLDDWLGGVSHPYPIAATPCEIWLLCQQDVPSVTAGFLRAVAYGEGSLAQRAISRNVVSAQSRLQAQVGNGTSGLNANGPAAEMVSRHVVRLQVGSTESIASLDGVAGVPTAVVPATTNARFRFGAFVNTGASNFWLGQIAAVLITNPLTGDKLTGLQSWLMARRKL